MWKKIKPYFISIVIALGVGGLAAFLTRNSMDIYKEINTPPLSPPSWLFPVVWTILYILMGISAAMIYKEKGSFDGTKEKALVTYAASLIFNFAWSIVFFNLKGFGVAVIILLILLFLIIRTILLYRKINKIAAYMQIPYAVWVAFAGYLNIGIWILN